MIVAAAVLAAHPIHALLVAVVVRYTAVALLGAWRDRYAVTSTARPSTWQPEMDTPVLPSC